MAYLIFLLATLALLIGFVAVVLYEKRHEVRFFGPLRASFDQGVERMEFVLAHVDFESFLKTEARRLVTKIGHDIVHLSLQLVRVVERLLTRIIRRLRTYRSVDPEPGASTREFVKVLYDFKGQLKDSHPDVPEM